MTTVLIFENDGIADRIIDSLSQWRYQLKKAQSTELDVFVVGPRETDNTYEYTNDDRNR